ncbi:MAG: AAA family ATPase, partial [Bacteroidales bacterium]|nr:AAA family ATPase [Bacteroidales bacterium]
MDYQIFIKGEDRTDRIKDWSRVGDRIQIVYSDGKSYMYGKDNVEIIESALLDKKGNNVFEYLKRIATVVSLENEQVGNILEHQYSKIDFVSSKSVLANFLTAKLPESQKTISNVIFPFGYNESQKIAVEKALANDLSIVEGPPGTGKTQTILNIIANAVRLGESVAVVSGNNSATKNVQEKLEKYNVDFISAYLGSVENKRVFIDNQEKKSLPNIKEWELSQGKKNEIETNLQLLSSQLDEKLRQKNRLAELRQMRDALLIEYKHFDKNYHAGKSDLYDDFLKNKNSDKIAEIAIFVENYKFREKHDNWYKVIKWFERLKLYFRYGIIDKAAFKDKTEIFISICHDQFYTKKIEEITTEIDSIEKELKYFDFEEKMKRYSEFSMQFFRDKLASKYADKDRQVFSQNELWKDPNKFIEEYPVILSTTYSLRSSLSSKTIYDYVIIDESSQVNLATGALALSCARKAVIVGDL